MSLSKLIKEISKKNVMGILRTPRGKEFIVRPDETGDYEYLGWETDSDYTRGQTHKWNKLPKGDVEWFDVDNPPATVKYIPIID